MPSVSEQLENVYGEVEPKWRDAMKMFVEIGSEESFIAVYAYAKSFLAHVLSCPRCQDQLIRIYNIKLEGLKALEKLLTRM